MTQQTIELSVSESLIAQGILEQSKTLVDRTMVFGLREVMEAQRLLTVAAAKAIPSAANEIDAAIIRNNIASTIALLNSFCFEQNANAGGSSQKEATTSLDNKNE